MADSPLIKVGIVGASGYAGAELLRMLSQHPAARIIVATSRSEAGMPVSAFFPNLRGHVEMAFGDVDNPGLATCDAVFFATPHGTAMRHAPRLLDAGCRVIDLSADFRIRHVPTWERVYGMRHASPKWVAKAVYGLPEWNRESIRNARLVANPGCFPTAILLGFKPLLTHGVVDVETLIADAVTGLSGAGRRKEAAFLFAEMSDNFKAYHASGHRHLHEISQELAEMGNRAVRLSFVPHLMPAIRGIHATLYARMNRHADLQKMFEDAYRDELFVDVHPEGSHPETRNLRGTNKCSVAVHQPAGSDIVVVLSVIDNLVKGAAGQAIQNMNVMFGLEEGAGLNQISLVP